MRSAEAEHHGALVVFAQDVTHVLGEEASHLSQGLQEPHQEQQLVVVELHVDDALDLYQQVHLGPWKKKSGPYRCMLAAFYARLHYLATVLSESSFLLLKSSGSL